jgi:hypothetical protein
VWIEISPEDRKKYDAPEQIPYNGGRWGLKQVDAMEQQVGWTIEDLGNELGRKQRNPDGSLVLVDVLDEDGNQVLDEDGKPEQVPVERVRPLAIAVIVWLSLWGAGVKVPWDDFDVSQKDVAIHREDEEPGKAEGSEPDPD